MSREDSICAISEKLPKRAPIIHGDCVELPLTQGKSAFVDLTDFNAVKSFTWTAARARNLWYAVASVSGRNVHLHRFLMGTDGPDVDHRDGNGLNCRRSNLRHCTDKENIRNRHSTHGASSFKGVSLDKRLRSWKAVIFVNGKQKTLGRFKVEEDAARAYDRAAREAFGEFAWLNFQD